MLGIMKLKILMMIYAKNFGIEIGIQQNVISPKLMKINGYMVKNNVKNNPQRILRKILLYVII